MKDEDYRVARSLTFSTDENGERSEPSALVYRRFSLTRNYNARTGGTGRIAIGEKEV